MKNSKGRLLGIATFAILTLLLNVDVYADAAPAPSILSDSAADYFLIVIVIIIVVCIITALTLRHIRNKRHL